MESEIKVGDFVMLNPEIMTVGPPGCGKIVEIKKNNHYPYCVKWEDETMIRSIIRYKRHHLIVLTESQKALYE